MLQNVGYCLRYKVDRKLQRPAVQIRNSITKRSTRVHIDVLRIEPIINAQSPYTPKATN
jgi:hypothetical protein